jgi:predicted ATPase/DNA-binding CsgD family transcriptional regulator
MPSRELRKPDLSRREREIAALVADGLTNRQIAQRLYISERTVDGHLEHIREKLGVNNRAQVATWFAQHTSHEAVKATVLTNLPLPVTSFVGRSLEVAEIKQRLAISRLVTVTGAGGVGKTRVAIEAATEVAQGSELMTAPGLSYSTVCFVDLTPLTQNASVEAAVISALGGREEAGQAEIDTIAALLANRHSLLLLDNCEHLVQPCAILVSRLLRLAPQLRVLATSRESLRVAGEVVIDLAPMLGHDALELFNERAHLVEHSLVESADTPTITTVCERLDRIPLAIELAAAWAGLLPADEILARLDSSLSLLTRGSRSAPARHQTLRAAIDWSHGLLDAPQRTLFRRLSVFSGGFSLPAAEAVCADDDLDPDGILGCVAELASKSMLSASRGAGGEARYRMLETLREYAAEHLVSSGEQNPVRARHLEYFARLAEDGTEELHGRDQLLWLDRFEQERANFLAALDMSKRTAPELGLKMAGALYWFWRVRGPYSEGPEWLARLLAAAPHARNDVRALALEGAGRLAVHLSDWSVARESLLAALRIWRELDEPSHIARTLVAIAMLSETWLLTGRPGELRDPDPIAALKEAIEVGQRAGDHFAVANALGWLGPPTARADLNAGMHMLMESLRISREAGDEWMVALATVTMGHITYDAGDLAQALHCYSGALQLFRRLREPWGIAVSLAYSARCELASSRIDEAKTAATQSLLVPGAVPDPMALEVLSGVAAAGGDYERALTLHGAAAGIPTSEPRVTGELEAQPWMSDARKVFGEDQIKQTWQQGYEMTRPMAILYALVLDESDQPVA